MSSSDAQTPRASTSRKMLTLPGKAMTQGPMIKTPSLLSPASMNSSSQSKQTGQAPSFFGLMASKRLAKRFASRARARRFGDGFSSQSGRQGPLHAEPTYRMEPKVKFNSSKVQDAVSKVVDGRLSGWKYSPKQATMMSKVVSEEVKEQIKKLGFERYKLVCLVTIGQKCGQGLQVTSRCSWDCRWDNSATYTWEGAAAYCSTTVYGVYHE